jgi:hypothetical protein
MSNSRRPPRRSPEEIAQVAGALRQRLAEWEDGADPALIAAALAQHAGYQGKNPLRIAMQDPDATDVRGYRAWQEIGRQVGKYPEGAGGIVILAVHDRRKPAADGNGTPPAEGAPGKVYEWNAEGPPAEGAQVIEGGSSGGRRGSSASMATVHDVRWTFPLFCAVEDCGLPIHLVAKEKATRTLQWAHTGRRGTGHDAKPPKPTGEPMVPQPPAAPVPRDLPDGDDLPDLGDLDELEA